jgi:hypothetical protein
MKKFFLSVRKALLSFWRWSGPLGCIVAVLAIIFVIPRFVMRAVFERSSVGVSVETTIKGMQKVSKLKPYKVITAGFATEIRQDGNETAKLDYQYKGMVEFVVDLSKMKISIDGDTVKVSLNRPTLSNPFMLPMPTNSLWLVEASRKMGERFLKEWGQIMSRRIRQDADTLENREKAKAQTERILRSMFLPTGIDESKIKFEWREDT